MTTDTAHLKDNAKNQCFRLALEKYNIKLGLMNLSNRIIREGDLKRKHRMFLSEQEMHNWLSKEFERHDIDGLAALVLNEEDLEKFSPHSTAEKIFKESFQKSLSSLRMTQKIIDNQNISQGGGILRPDFILYGADEETIAVVELKNFKNPTREAGTEIGAYTNEIKTNLPFISDGDVIGIIISSEWPTLLKRYITHEIVWLQRKLICLEPCELNGKKGLVIKSIGDLIDTWVTHTFEKDNFGGYQICLYDEDLFYGRGEGRLNNHIPQMKSALQIMAAKGNALRAHGCAFLWKDHSYSSLAPYSILLLNVACFDIADKLLTKKKYREWGAIDHGVFNVIRDYNPTGHSKSHHEIFETSLGYLKTFCKPRQEGYGKLSGLNETMKDRAELISFSCWGFLADQHAKLLEYYYLNHGPNYLHDNPAIGVELIRRHIDGSFGVDFCEKKRNLI